MTGRQKRGSGAMPGPFSYIFIPSFLRISQAAFFVFQCSDRYILYVPDVMAL